jgi:hypothetical protein
MERRAPSVRWQRLGLMILMAGLSAAGLALQPAPRAVDPPRPRPAASRPERPSAPHVPAAAPASQPPAEAVPASPDVEPMGVGPAVWTPAEPSPVVPDVVVGLPPHEPDAPYPANAPPGPVDVIHSAEPSGEQALALVDAGGGTRDGIEGFEPGMQYWFGPRGLQKIEDLGMEAEQ